MEDREIIALYWDRDEEAIPATAEKYGGYCAAIARSILNNREEAEECVNDTWLRAWNAMPPQWPEVLSAFLGRITRNLSLNRYCHITAEKRGGGQTALVLEELADCVSDRETVEGSIDRKELLAAIDRFLAALPERKRNIFLCRYWYFDSVDDIACRFGITANHVSVMLNRLRQKLRTYLTERGFEL